MSCPNVNSPQWQALVEKIGVFEAFKEFRKNGEQIPDASNYPATFKGVNTTLKIVRALTQPKAQEMFNRFYLTGKKEKFFNELTNIAGASQVKMLTEWEKNNPVESINDMIAGVLSEMSFTVKIDVTKRNVNENYGSTKESNFRRGDTKYWKTRDGVRVKQTNEERIQRVSEEEWLAAYNEKVEGPNTDFYKNLTVPGGVNYTENEIATPDITPSIQGHAQFATKNGIGWFRSDDRRINKNENRDTFAKTYQVGIDNVSMFSFSTEEEALNWIKENLQYSLLTDISKIEYTKTRRILEVQSDLFQKGRNDLSLVGNEGYETVRGNDEQKWTVVKTKSGQLGYNISDIVEQGYETLPEAEDAKQRLIREDSRVQEAIRQNQFLQLLNKDNNWVTFFIRSIIQDSIRKGYEKVLFPSGDTASKVEGHTTLEEFKKQKQERINKLKSQLVSNDRIQKETDLGETYYFIDTDNFTPKQIMSLSGEFPTRDTAEKVLYEYNVNTNLEILQLEKELNDVEANGLAQLKPIWNFYENMVANILKKNYRDNITTITDEYGNTWTELSLPKESETVFLQQEASAMPSKASAKTIARIHEFLKRIGVEVKSVENIVFNGKKLGANGIAYPLQKLIEVVNGTEAGTLPEEAMHMAVEMLKQTNPGLYKKMLNAIGNYKIYNEVFKRDGVMEEYQVRPGLPDIIKLKEEAIAKLLTEYVIYQGEGLVEKPENMEKVSSWWRDILEWFKVLFTKAEFDPFEEAAKQVFSEQEEMFQLASATNDLKEPADAALNARLIDFLKPLGITVEMLDNLKRRTGVDAIGAADILNKLILINEGKAKLDTLPEETAHFFVELLGNRHPLVQQMMKKIDQWDGFATVYQEYNSQYKGNMDMIRKEAIGKLISQHIVNHRNTPTSLLKDVQALIQEAIDHLLELLGIKGVSIEQLTEDIAIDILTRNYSKIKRKMPAGSRLTNFESTVEKDPKANYIQAELRKAGFLLTGSLALRKQGTVYRSKDENLHDLDFKVPKYMHDNWREILEKHFNPNRIETDYEFSREGEKIYGLKIDGITVDFFVKEKEDLRAAKDGFADWRDIFAAKLGLGSSTLGREKDIADFLTFQAFEKSEGFDNSDQIFFQLSGTEKRDRIWDKITEVEKQLAYDKVTSPTNPFYTINGKKIARRVSDLVHGRYKRYFDDKTINKEQWQADIDETKRQTGDDIHLDMFNLYKRHVDENGYIRKAPLNRTEPIQTNPETYAKLESYLRATLAKYPNARIKAEVKIYDGREGKDMAGTIDLLIIDGEGTTHILDWKSMNLNTSEFKDIPFYKKEVFDLQLRTYAEILKFNYGIDKFGEKKAIPIITSFSKKGADIKQGVRFAGITIGDPDPKKITNDYLLPIPTIDQSSGDEKLDFYIKKLRNLHEVISGRKVKENRKDLKAEQLNAIMKAIRHLQIKQNVVAFIEQGEVFTKEIQRTLENYNKIKNENLNDKEIRDFSDELDANVEAFNIYANVDINLKHLFDLSKQEDKETYDRIRELSESTRMVAETLKTAYTEFTEKFIASKRGINNLTLPEKVVKGATKLFRTLSQAPTKALQTLWLMKDEAVNRTDFQTDEQIKRLSAIKEAYESWARSRGLNNRDMFSPIMKKDENGKVVHELIDEYEPEFYSALDAAIRNDNRQWIKDNVDMEAVLKKAAELKAEKLKLIDETIYPGTAEEQNKRKDREKAILAARYDIKHGIYSNYHLLKQFPLEKHHTAQYKYLQANKEAMALYQYMREWNKRAVEYDYISGKRERTFIPYVRKGAAEKFVFGGSLETFRSIADAFTVSDSEVGYGRINPFTGKIEDNIPVYFTRKVEGEQYSTDLFKVMGLFVSQVIEHRNLSNLESQANLLLKVEKNKGSIQTNLTNSPVRDETGQLQILASNEENSQLFEDFMKAAIYKQRYINRDNIDILGGRIGDKFNKYAEKLNKFFGHEIFSTNTQGGKFSLVKAIDSANRLFQLKVLGLNVITGIANFAGANFQVMINAGKYYTKTEFLKAEWMMSAHKVFRDNAHLHMALMKHFLPLTEGQLADELNRLSLSKLTQHSFSDFMMVLMRKADHMVQYANFLAMMENSMVDEQGNIVNIREFVRRSPEYSGRYKMSAEQRKELERNFEKKVEELKQKSIVNTASIVNGELVIPNLPSRFNKNVYAYRSLMKQIAKNATANITEDDMSKIRMNVITRSMMVFKNWIPRMIDVRAGELRFNVGTHAYEWGRARMVVSILSHGIIKGTRDLIAMASATEKGVESLRELYLKKAAAYKELTGEDFDLSEEEFFDLVRSNIQAQMREIIILSTSMLMFFAGFKWLPPDDEDWDDTDKNAWKYAHRTMDKITDEVSFYYNPISMQQILNGSIFPSLGLILDLSKITSNIASQWFGVAFENEEMQEKAQPLKYTMKAIPVTKEMVNYISIFYPELAKEMGIRISTESRAR